MAKAWALFATLFLMPSFAAAAESGFFIGASIGYGSVNAIADTSQGVEFGALSFGPLPVPEIIAAGVDNVAFEGDEMIWSGQIGYRLSRNVEFEFAFSEFGSFGSSQATGFPSSAAKLDISEFSIGARLRYPFNERFGANWYLGISRASFEASGSASVIVSFGGIPPTGLITVSEPYSDPDDETGYVWGFGVDFRLSERVRLDLNYKRHETQVLPIESLNFGVIFSL